MSVASYVTDKGILWGQMAAMSIIMILPMILFGIGIGSMLFHSIPNNLTAFIDVFFIILFIVFLLYPGIGTRIFRLFKCRHIGEMEYLMADYSIVCWKNDHNYAVAVAVLCIFLYVIGIPLILHKGLPGNLVEPILAGIPTIIFRDEFI